MSVLQDKLLYLDCFSGISGDMMLAGLVDLGVPLEVIQNQVAELALPGVGIDCQPVKRGAFSASKLTVSVEQPEDQGHGHRHAHYGAIYRLLCEKLTSIETRTLAVDMFEQLAAVEGKLHGVIRAEVTFHELGAVDSIVDIVGIAAAMAWLKPCQIQSRVVPLGGGMIATAHGKMPVPAPATLELLRGAVVSGGPKNAGELVTPTGAVVLSRFVTGYGSLPEMRVVATGWGAGDRDLPGQANVLRLVLGEPLGSREAERLLVLEANIDDMNPELYEYVFSRLFEAGALDVWTQPVMMKKGRPGNVLSVLCTVDFGTVLTELLLAQTTTLGVRTHPVDRISLTRKTVLVDSTWGSIPVKVGWRADRVFNVAPEYEACAGIARKHSISLKDVYRVAHANFMTQYGELSKS